MQNKDWFRQGANLGQQLSKKYPLYAQLAGTDKELSDSIAILNYLKKKKVVHKDEVDFIIGLLNVLRMSSFATSDRVNEITKMGLQMPKGADEVTF